MDELCSLSGESDIHKLSLKLLQDYYKTNLMPYTYEFELPGDTTIKLNFPKAQFCHLLAIEKIMTLQGKKMKNVKNYKGLKGYNNIENLLLTLDNLNTKPHKSYFRKSENKFLYFHLLHKLIEKPILLDFDQSKVNPSTFIQADLLFYDVMSENYIHLGVINPKKSENNYVPCSFFVEPKGSPCIDKYTDGQAEIIFKTSHKKEILLPR